MTASPRWAAAHAASLGLWLGALVITGASAAIIFPTMRETAPTLGAYAGYSGEHWKLAAGMVQARVFAVADVFTAACAVLACVALAGLWMNARWTGPIAKARVALIVAACMILGYQLFVLGPIMSQNLRQYWTLAASGDNAGAEQLRSLFEADHPKASALFYAQFALVAASLLLSIVHRPPALSVRGAGDA